MLRLTRDKAVIDQKAHAVGIRHPWRKSGVAFACGYQRRRIFEVLENAVAVAVEKLEADEFVGFGVDLAAPRDPVVTSFRRPKAPPH